MKCKSKSSKSVIDQHGIAQLAKQFDYNTLLGLKMTNIINIIYNIIKQKH